MVIPASNSLHGAWSATVPHAVLLKKIKNGNPPLGMLGLKSACVAEQEFSWLSPNSADNVRRLGFFMFWRRGAARVSNSFHASAKG